MSLVDYVGKSQFWTKMRRAVGTQLLTSVNLYDEAILRAFDRGRWVYDQLLATRALLASQVSGTQAVKQGSVDLSTLNYADVGGDLNGLTVQMQADTGGLKTVTFGDGAGFAPGSPADVVSQINAQTSGQPAASLDSGNKLMIKSTTTGGTSTITTSGGTALALLGLSVGAGVAGAGAGGSGAEAVGVPAITGTGSSFTSAAGTLFATLQSLANKFNEVPFLTAAANVFTHDLTVQGTFTSSGGMTCSGVNALTGITTCSNSFTVSGAHTTTLSQDVINVSGATCTFSGTTLNLSAANQTVTTPLTYNRALIPNGASAIRHERDPLVIAAGAAATAITLDYDSAQCKGPSVDQVWTLPACPAYATEIELIVFNAGTHDIGIRRNGVGSNFVLFDHTVATYSYLKVKSSDVSGSWAWGVAGYCGGAVPDLTAVAN